MKIWHISDSHGFHDYYQIPDNIDMVIHSGDSTNYYNKLYNIKEYNEFLKWYSSLSIPIKIYVAGNHDASCTIYNKKDHKKELLDKGIIYLEDEGITINNYLFYGTPYTPTFGNWYFMKSRSNMYKIWEQIPENVDILITHGPPKGINDLTRNNNNSLEQVGDISIYNYLPRWSNLKYYLHGHIHNSKGIINTGVKTYNGVQFVNSSGVEDGSFKNAIIYNGTIINL